MASEMVSLSKNLRSGPFQQRTVKGSLTVELVSNTYRFDFGGGQRLKLEAAQPTSDFDKTVEHIKQLAAPKPKRVRKGKKAADREEFGDGE